MSRQCGYSVGYHDVVWMRLAMEIDRALQISFMNALATIIFDMLEYGYGINLVHSDTSAADL